ncbi:hypothetical protein ACKVMT_13390 [Halobacteriales archaeon Cl-PHB]
MDFENLVLSVTKEESEAQRPEGRTVEVNRPLWIARFNLVYDLIEQYHRDGSILEIGAYRYNLTTIFEMKGYDVDVVDKVLIKCPATSARKD